MEWRFQAAVYSLHQASALLKIKMLCVGNAFEKLLILSVRNKKIKEASVHRTNITF